MPRRKSKDKGSPEESLPYQTMEEILERFRVKGLTDLLPKISNLVTTVDLDCKFDLHHIAKYAGNVSYNPKSFSAAIIRVRSPIRATYLIFGTGKIVITGCRSEPNARLAVRKLVAMLSKLGYAPEYSKPRLVNIVATTDLNCMIRLEGFHQKHSNFVSFEPEIFAGLVYEFLRPKLKMIAFANGKAIFVGARHIEDVYYAFEQVYPTLMEFKIAQGTSYQSLLKSGGKRKRGRKGQGRAANRRWRSSSTSLNSSNSDSDSDSDSD
jgi:transcription initiation factor TFIID TATA-box-binding protein